MNKKNGVVVCRRRKSRGGQKRESGWGQIFHTKSGKIIPVMLSKTGRQRATKLNKHRVLNFLFDPLFFFYFLHA